MLAQKSKKQSDFTKWILSKSNRRWLNSYLPQNHKNHKNTYLQSLAKLSECMPGEIVYLKFELDFDEIETVFKLSFKLSFNPTMCKLSLQFCNRFLHGSVARQAGSK